MKNTYIENLMEIPCSQQTMGQRLLCGFYDQVIHKGFECFVVANSFSVKSAAGFYEELVKAGIYEIYYASDSSNYMASLLALQKAGAKIDGIVELENPAYKREMEAYGESWERTTIPAIKFTLG